MRKILTVISGVIACATEVFAVSFTNPSIQIFPGDFPSTEIAAKSHCLDWERVTGTPAVLCSSQGDIIAGTMGCGIEEYLDEAELESLEGRREMYLMKAGDGRIVIAGSDRRGTVYGIYALSAKIGVSPWYWWADVPVQKRASVEIPDGIYTEGEPAVRYRGIFLNDEAPCLTSWVKNTWGTDWGDHRFYEKVFELILRLKGNFLWPAMWGWAFYEDDPLNSETADRMGIIIGTSHHEPMARNHQEWARRRSSYGQWNYRTNRKVLDKFFEEGMRRAATTEDLITIGMRGDGDEAMGGDGSKADIELLERIIRNQRNIIRKVTGKPASQRPQVWALYKEVQTYYDLGLRVPDDVTILLSDDNWGDIRRIPAGPELGRSGGWGMYYHVDYVGAPRNSKWLCSSQVQHIWEQMRLAWDAGVDRLWILNVGDLKPMEYPIQFFLDMAWNPEAFDTSKLAGHAERFCSSAFGADQGPEAARLLLETMRLNARSTAEMLDSSTYTLEEWDKVTAEYARAECAALNQFIALEEDARDAYRQLILFPLQAMGNLHGLYRAVANNADCARRADPRSDEWADEAERLFRRDSVLCAQYNLEMSSGKWNGMMTQKHIGYTSWNDDFPADVLPGLERLGECPRGGFSFPVDKRGYTSIEAEHWYEAQGDGWTVIPGLGRTLSGVTLPAGLNAPEGKSLSYRFEIPQGTDSVTCHVIVKSTLAFDGAPHSYKAGIGENETEIRFNADLNEDPENIYSTYYPTVARRVVEKSFTLPCTPGWNVLTLTPLSPRTVFEKIVLDYGGYDAGAFLFGDESVPFRQESK